MPLSDWIINYCPGCLFPTCHLAFEALVVASMESGDKLGSGWQGNSCSPCLPRGANRATEPKCMIDLFVRIRKHFVRRTGEREKREEGKERERELGVSEERKQASYAGRPTFPQLKTCTGRRRRRRRGPHCRHKKAADVIRVYEAIEAIK